ncbi:MAG: hypothetical protein J6K42_03290 [Clostridia bacterium]|nr:hypothetical protein [Clostridia bacterium]
MKNVDKIFIFAYINFTLTYISQYFLRPRISPSPIFSVPNFLRPQISPSPIFSVPDFLRPQHQAKKKSL